MKGTVLLVDDEPRLLDGLKRTLSREPYQILTATSADEALKVLQGIRVDVVISDQKMPGLSGVDFLALVRDKYPETVRVMLTGAPELTTAIEAINKGEIFRFFTKPCNEIDLALTIRDALRQKDLIAQVRRLIRVMRTQSGYIARLEHQMPGVLTVNRDNAGTIVIEEPTQDLTEILEEITTELDDTERRLGTRSKEA